MSKEATSDLPFGFDEDVQRKNLEEGEYTFIIHPKTHAGVSKSSGNPMITLKAALLGDENDEYWPVRSYFVLRGRGSGMFKKLLRACGFEPDEYIGEKLSLYGGSDDAKEVAEFFNAAVVPDLVGCTFNASIEIEQARNKDGELMTTREGEPVMSPKFKDYWPD